MTESRPVRSTRRVALIAVIGCLAIGLAIALGLAWHRHPDFFRASGVPQRHDPLRHEAYIWQRNWDGRVQESLAAHHESFTRMVALAAEVNWANGRPTITRVGLDAASLRDLPTSTGWALRIGAYRGPFSQKDSTIQFLGDLAASLIVTARTNALEMDELQIDFDCAENNLAGYREWILALKARVAPIALTITALPSWLKRREFAGLARATDGFVLQVHSLERPRHAEDAFQLCDPVLARRWTEQAGQLNVPFRVALPTYGYRLAFDERGKFAGLQAETAGTIFSEPATWREVHADPVLMAGLVREWSASRPTSMQGVIWYRLPVAGDSLNWPWATLSEVIAGRVPTATLQVHSRASSSGLTEVALTNEGRAEFYGRPMIRVSWTNANSGAKGTAPAGLMAADGLGGFVTQDTSPNALEWRSEKPIRIDPGALMWIGWLRLAASNSVRVDLLQQP